MRGFLALSFQAVHAPSATTNARLVSGLIELRPIIKGDDGHTAERLAQEMVDCMRSLAVVYELDQASRGVDDGHRAAQQARIAMLKSDAGTRDAVVVRLAREALVRAVGIVTDGGANMAKAARDLMAAHGGGERRARLCVAHTLQLVLKYFCIQDVKLADALAGRLDAAPSRCSFRRMR